MAFSHTQKNNFAVNIATLLRTPDSADNAKIAKRIGVTSSTLSQWAAGRIKPAFDKLLGIAACFNISLDELVFGDISGSGYQRPVSGGRNDDTVSELREAMDELRRQSLMHTRIANDLFRHIETTARELLDSKEERIYPGLGIDEDHMRLEQYCHEICVFTLDLRYDIVPEPGDYERGPYFEIVRKNIKNGVKYRFLLPGKVQGDWEKRIQTLYAWLDAELNPDQVRTFCEFRICDTAAFAGYSLFHINEDSLKREEPFLYAIFEEWFSHHWLGSLFPSNAQFRGFVLMDPWHLENAQKEFERLWETASLPGSV